MKKQFWNKSSAPAAPAISPALPAGRTDADCDAAKYTATAPPAARWQSPVSSIHGFTPGPNADIRAVKDAVQQHSAWLMPLRPQMGRVIIGQQQLIDRLIVGLLGNGHLLLEGVPGLAKTLSLKTLAAAIPAQFRRIQFTPAMLPADIVGSMIYNPREGTFHTKHGPVLANLILADEINRALAKVQSALLEAMQERQVTLGEETHRRPDVTLARLESE